MWSDTIEQLKKQWTDKYVVVAEDVPELKRFAGRTGRVKTVNMNGRVLVEFIGGVDIARYDIDPAFLTVVEAPQAAAEPAQPEKKPKAVAKAAAPAASAKGKSPLELAREQGAARSAQAAAKPTAEAGEKLSPLELARRQGAAKKQQAPAAAEPKTGGTTEAAPAAGGKKLSPLELARMQGAAKRESAETTAEQPAPQGQSVETEAETANEPESAESTAAEQPPTKPEPTASSGKKLSPLELARRQGPAKR